MYIHSKRKKVLCFWFCTISEDNEHGLDSYKRAKSVGNWNTFWKLVSLLNLTISRYQAFESRDCDSKYSQEYSVFLDEHSNVESAFLDVIECQ